MGAVTCCTRPLESTEEPAARISGPGGRTPTSRRAESGWPASAAAAARRVGSNAAACGARLVSRNYHRRTTASGPGPVGSNPVGLRLPAEHRVGWAHPRAQGRGQGTPTVLQASASRGPCSSDAGGTRRDGRAAPETRCDAAGIEKAYSTAKAAVPGNTRPSRSRSRKKISTRTRSFFFIGTAAHH